MITPNDLRALVLGDDAIEMLSEVLKSAAEEKMTSCGLECDNEQQAILTKKFLDAMGYDVVMLHFESLDCPYHLQISWG